MSAGYRTIDTEMHGLQGITGAFVIAGQKTALVETGPKTSLQAVEAGLEAHGVENLDWIVVTHIHLDHAGAAGTLAARFPDARVAVHERGAPHLVDPAKLWASAGRIYGDDMERLWGGIDPIAEDRIHVLADGEKIDLGGRSLQAVETPGHARHHHALLDDSTGCVFTGDALGVRLPDVGAVRPATPPPEFDLESAIASIERIRALKPTELCLTHFGPSSEGASPLGVDETCDEAIRALRTWAEWVSDARSQGLELDEAAGYVAEQAAAATEGSADQIARMEQTTSYRMNTWGYLRYMERRDRAS